MHDDWSLPQELRLMWDHTVDWPLWREDRLEDDDPAYVEDVLGLSAGLIRDLRAWAVEAELLRGTDGRHGLTRESWRVRTDALDGWGESLVERLRHELPTSIPVRHHR